MLPIVSVIVPVYNIEPYIDDCVDSILKSTYKNIEIILVDDGSQDSSSDKCDIWKTKDSRIRVIHQENQGVSVARNVGIDASSGEYIIFVDGDDIIHPQMLYSLLKVAIENKNEIVFCKYEKFYNTEEIENLIMMDLSLFETDFCSSKEYLVKLLQYSTLDVVWNGLYYRDVVLKNKFEIGKRNEDLWWKYLAVDSTDKIACISSCLYYYRKRQRSIMSTFSGIKNLDYLEGKYYRARYIADKYPAMRVLAFSNVLAECMNAYILAQSRLEGQERGKAIDMIIKFRENTSLTVMEILKDKKIFLSRKFSLILQNKFFKPACYLKMLVLNKSF